MFHLVHASIQTVRCHSHCFATGVQALESSDAKPSSSRSMNSDLNTNCGNFSQKGVAGQTHTSEASNLAKQLQQMWLCSPWIFKAHLV